MDATGGLCHADSIALVARPPEREVGRGRPVPSLRLQPLRPPARRSVPRMRQGGPVMTPPLTPLLARRAHERCQGWLCTPGIRAPLIPARRADEPTATQPLSAI